MRTDPLQKLVGLAPGRRVSLRLEGPEGATDRIGLVVSLTDRELVLEDRAGRVQTIDRASVRLARLVPTVARGRNPRHAPVEMLRALAADPALGADPGAACWVARLCDLVDHLDDSGVRPLPGATDTAATAGAPAGSRALVNGEWAAAHLVAGADLAPLAAWAARRNARNVVLTSPLPGSELAALGLAEL